MTVGCSRHRARRSRLARIIPGRESGFAATTIPFDLAAWSLTDAERDGTRMTKAKDLDLPEPNYNLARAKTIKVHKIKLGTRAGIN